MEREASRTSRRNPRTDGDADVNVDALADRAVGLLLVGFEGTKAYEIPIGLLRHVGGIVLFARNIVDADQTRALVDDLQTAAREAGHPPLIVAIDEEGGTVSRIRGIGTHMPSAMALGAARDPSVTRAVYRAIGEEIGALGVTLDFAPVADANTNPSNPVIGVRSFGEPSIAAGLVAAAIGGLHDSGVAATAKHFPGHGDASVDSHEDLPIIDVGLDRLHAVELEPFRAAIAAGVDAVMTAHIALPQIDATGAPATLSRIVLTGVLRDELGFEGVICTDCMQMEAIAARNPQGEAAVRAIDAGADLITYSTSIGAATEAAKAIGDAIRSGRLDPGQVQRCLERVDALRQRALAANARPRLDSIGSPSHRATALDAARRAITVIRDPGSIVPLALREGDRIFVVEFAGASSPVESAGKHQTALGALLDAGSPAKVQEQIRTLEPAGHEYKQLLMAAGSATAIVAITRRASAHPLQAQAVGDLALAGKPLVVVAAREPYDASIAPPEAAVIAAYGDDPSTVQAVADVLLGASKPQGALPVSLDANPEPAADVAKPTAVS
jgi:beta-N-acetylhexosaminidase